MNTNEEIRTRYVEHLGITATYRVRDTGSRRYVAFYDGKDRFYKTAAAAFKAAKCEAVDQQRKRFAQ